MLYFGCVPIFAANFDKYIRKNSVCHVYYRFSVLARSNKLQKAPIVIGGAEINMVDVSF